MDDKIIVQIKEYFSRYKSDRNITSSIVEKFLLKNRHINEMISRILNEFPEWGSKRNAIIGIIFDRKLRKCKTCKKYLNFKNLNSNQQFCSSKCSNSNLETKHKKEKTCLKHFGVKSNFQSELTKKKTKETSLKLYGTSHPLKNKDIYEKVKNTNKEKYGVDFLMQSSFIYDKRRKTCLRKYSVLNNSMKNLWKNIESWKDYVIPLFGRDEWKGYSKNYNWRCSKCGHDFVSHVHKNCHLEVASYIPRCPKCYPSRIGHSKAEDEIRNFCKNFFPDSCKKSKNFIKPFELDLVIPEMKLALEFNGSYWHSNLSENYHLNKTKLCNAAGYRLIHIWEDEWNSDKDEIKRRLKDIFEGKENLNFSDEEIKLDRSWYNNVEIPGYAFKEETSPEIIIRNGFKVENCGLLVYIKKYEN